MFKGFGNSSSRARNTNAEQVRFDDSSANVEEGDCGDSSEKCWNQFTLRPSARKRPDFCLKNRTGCQNWEELEIRGFTDDWKRADDCMAQCRRIKPCVAFNFHADGPGTCMLFNDTSCVGDG